MTLHPRLQALDARDLGDGLTLLAARTRRTRGRGLAGLDELPADHALLLEPCRSVHTMGMRFALDLVWLDGRGEMVRLDADVAPRRMRSCRRARAVVECATGDGERFARSLAACAAAPSVSAAEGRGSPHGSTAATLETRCDTTTMAPRCATNLSRTWSSS